MDKDNQAGGQPRDTAQEVQERSSVEEALKKASSEWRATFDATNELIMMIGEDCRIIKANRATTVFFDRPFEEVLGREARSFFEDMGLGEMLPLQGVMETGLHIESEVQIPDRGLWILASADPIVDDGGAIAGAVVILRDITELKHSLEERQEMQSQLLQVQKMDSIGRLAGGVAHDFNNMLSAILSYSDLALMKLPDDHPVRGHMQIILNAAEKAGALTRQLLAFSRKQVLEKKVVTLSDTVDNMGRMLARIIRENVNLTIRDAGKGTNILADPGQVEQVIMNLVVNARDAMPDGGALTIKTDSLSFDESSLPLKGMDPGAYVTLAVSDEGEGIPPEVVEKVFEPFFTTKEEGKGTGLGLSTVYGIVRQHEGFIDIQSTPGKGTTFTVYFPLTDEKGEVRLSSKGLDFHKGDETILAVDDDESIRMLLADSLEPLGYRLTVVDSGEKAIKAGESSQEPIDLLLSDVMMPGMNGRELAERFRTRWPETKVVLMTGYPDEVLEEYLARESGVRFLEKPLTPGKLASIIRATLDGHE